MDIEQIERIVKDALAPCSTQTLRELVELAENEEDKETSCVPSQKPEQWPVR